MNDREDSQEFARDEPVTFAEVLGWLEFGGWVTLALVPILYFTNGPAVSPDQFVVRIGLVGVSVGMGPGLSLRRWMRTR